MLEPTVFSKQEIINQIRNKYNICITKIEIESRGSANIFYVYDDKDKKYVFKEFESACNEENVMKEIKIINHLRSDGIKVPKYIPTINNDYYFKYKNRTVILMEFIDGYTKESNTGNKSQVIESAQILGKMLKSLESFEDMPEDNLEKWIDNSKLKFGKEKFVEILKEIEYVPDDENINQIKLDLNVRIDIINSLQQNDYSEMKNLTMKNSHGDYSIMQFIYKNEKVEALLDFAKARKMPITWEIIRSFTYIDEDSKNGNLNLDNLIEYIRKVLEYVELNKYDLKYMPYFYLIQLVSSPFGYEQYLKDNTQKKLLEFAFWRCKMSKTLFYRLDEISTKLVGILNR